MVNCVAHIAIDFRVAIGQHEVPRANHFEDGGRGSSRPSRVGEEHHRRRPIILAPDLSWRTFAGT